MKNNDFDVVICVAAKDNLIVRTTIKLVSLNINPTNIYILTKPQYILFYRDLLKKYNVIVLDEDKVVPNLTFSSLDQTIKNRLGIPLRTGWYFQQFLKMGFATSHYARNYYLIWDADTLPVNCLTFFDNEHPLFTMKTEFHKPYFDTLLKLINIDKIAPFSFIAEHMLVNVKIMNELITKIGNEKIFSDKWYKKIINSINPNEEYGFSEFETYGTYTTVNYPKLYLNRELNTRRDGGYEFGRVVFPSDIKVMSRNLYDTVSLEPAHKPKYWKRQFQLIIKIILYLINYTLDFFSKIGK